MLFVYLEDAGIGNAAGFVMELKGIKSSDEIAQLHGCLFGNLRNIFYFSAKKTVDLKIIRFATVFHHFERNVRDGGVGVELNYFMVLIGHRWPGLARCPEGSQ